MDRRLKGRLPSIKGSENNKVALGGGINSPYPIPMSSLISTRISANRSSLDRAGKMPLLKRNLAGGGKGGPANYGVRNHVPSISSNSVRIPNGPTAREMLDKKYQSLNPTVIGNNPTGAPLSYGTLRPGYKERRKIMRDTMRNQGRFL